jgi:hypothetical protein
VENQPPKLPYANSPSLNSSQDSVVSQNSSRSGKAQTQRPRVNSTSSQQSTTRIPRVPVPPFISGSVLPSAKESTMRSTVDTKEIASVSNAGSVDKPDLSQRPSSSSTITQSTLQVPSSENPSATASPAESTLPLTTAAMSTSPPSASAQEWKPSPLSNTQVAAIVSPERPSRSSVSDAQGFEEPGAKAEKEKGGGGLKGRLQRALKKDGVDIVNKSHGSPNVCAPIRSEVPSPGTASPLVAHIPPKTGMGTSTSLPALQTNQLRYNSDTSEASTASSALPTTPPNPPPTPLHELGQRRPSNSSFAPSLIEPLDGKAKGKGRSMFNLRNASTDNISISSTVSSASMMIRRMGALGKLARRNR